MAAEEMGYLFADGTASPPAVPAAVPLAAHAVGDALAQSRLDGWGRDGVRAMLARKLCRLLPGLPPDRRETVTDVACRALEQLARDHATQVRAALASAITDVACAPPAVVRRLAADVERCVAEPILHGCATLTDDDLLAVIATRPETWRLAAIARRDRVGAPVADAIVATGDTAATGVLLDNDGAEIPEPTLERLVADAARQRAWQAGLARRAALPARLAVRLAGFVDRLVVDLLRTRRDFDDTTVAEIAATVRRRVDWVAGRDPEEGGERRALRLHRTGRLDEAALGDALSWNERDFVRAALALAAAAPPAAVDAILGSGDGRAVTALVWRAGFGMRCAMQVQSRAAGLPPPAMLNARRGTDFPLMPTEMERLLARYGVG
ncbi:DUF2336 domain-containing protein [Azospirillum halopraeferens]|uniref:DUF2336 domain-containing protein n=1 Tax=Azospirillum halopraeferens TaxID=34010 RepID=UPI001FE037FA|nr:DUF2336 domain-containing protein [Azospirillum halopraeferens]